MTWQEKKQVLDRVGYPNFESEEEFEEWFSEAEDFDQNRIRKAICQYNQNSPGIRISNHYKKICKEKLYEQAK